MNDKGGSYIPKSRIKSVTTRLGKTIGGDKLKDGNGISDTKIKGRNVSSDNDDYLTKSEIRSIKTIDGRVIKSDYIKDGNLLKKTANKYPKVTRTQFEEERYSYAEGGSVDAETQRKIDNLEKFINNPENQKKDPATVDKFKKILSEIKAKYKTTSKSEKEKEKEEEDEEVVDLSDIQVGDSARVISENKMGLIIKKNGKKFNLKFVNGTEKTYDASELEFIKSDNEYEEEEEEEKVSKPKSKAGRPKGTTSTKSEAKTKPQKGVKVTGSSTVSIDGKEVDMDSKEFCDYLLSKFKERREKSKNAPKKRTPSVMSKITTNVERSVVQAIKSSVESNKKAIEKNPDFFVKKVEKLESSTKSFLQSMKDVLGDDFKEKEISSTLKNIEELTESLIAKFKKK